MLLSALGDLSNAVPHLAEAVRLLPKGYSRQYNVVDMHYALGETYYRLGRFAECVPVLSVVLDLSSNHTRGNLLMAMSKARLGETETSRPYFENAVRTEPKLAKLPDYHEVLASNYARQGRYAEGLKNAEKAHQLAVAAGRSDQAARLPRPEPDQLENGIDRYSYGSYNSARQCRVT